MAMEPMEPIFARDRDCCICLQPLHYGVSCWECEHLVHLDCVRDVWYRRALLRCPLCRQPWGLEWGSRLDRYLANPWGIDQRGPPPLIGPFPLPRPLPENERPPQPSVAPHDVLFLCCSDLDDLLELSLIHISEPTRPY